MRWYEAIDALLAGLILVVLVLLILGIVSGL